MVKKKAILVCFLMTRLIGAVVAQEDSIVENSARKVPMVNLILIHGAWHGGWAWSKVVPLLEKEGYNVIAPDLPGLGSDHISPEIVTMQMYADFVVDLIRQQEGKVILVGHSLAGGIISQVAEKIPEKIEKLIYLCAFYMKNGESAFDIIAKNSNGNSIEFNYYNDNKVFEVKEEYLQPFFYNDCSFEDIKIAKKLLRAQAIEPFGAKMNISDAKYGQVERVYIECIKDMGIPLEIQSMMVAAQPCRVYTLETGHSPFFSNPQALVDVLNKEVK